jgi:outer membrane protein OmpA-like peptidoglycan-associated protein
MIFVAALLIVGAIISMATTIVADTLQERRASAVVSDLVRRGLAASRLSAAGIGEARPLASNNDESGRAMNRRVEIRCQ